MADRGKVRRRLLGAAALISALGLLVAGETVLKNRLGPLGFLMYWVVCLGLTGLAIAIALADARAVAQKTLDEQRDLFNSTLKEIEREARTKRPQKTGGNGQS